MTSKRRVLMISLIFAIKCLSKSFSFEEVIPWFCIAQPYGVQFLVSLARALAHTHR